MATVKMTGNLQHHINAAVIAPFNPLINQALSKFRDPELGSRAGWYFWDKYMDHEKLDLWRQIPSSWRIEATSWPFLCRISGRMQQTEFTIRLPEPMPQALLVAVPNLERYGTVRQPYTDQREALKVDFPGIWEIYGPLYEDLARLIDERDTLSYKVQHACRNAPSLNKLLKEAPGMARYVPEHYVEKMREKTSRVKSDWTADDLQAAVLRGNVLTSAKNGG